MDFDLVGIDRTVGRAATRIECYLRVKRLKRILKSISLPRRYSGRIVIGNIRGGDFYIIFDYVLATLLSKLGFETIVLTDDGILAHHDLQRMEHPTSQLQSVGHREVGAFLPRRHTRLVPESLLNRRLRILDRPATWVQDEETAVRFLRYSQLAGTDVVNASELQGVIRQIEVGSISKHVDASHRRFFGGRDFDYTDRQHVEYATHSAFNEAMSRRVAESLLQYRRPDLYITLDGIYSISGPIVETMRASDVPVLIYQPNGFNDRSIYIGEEHFSINSITSHWHRFLESHCTSEVALKARRFMDDRTATSAQRDAETWITRIASKKERHRKVVFLFPNLTWDGAIEERNTIFGSLGDWLKSTVEHFTDSDILLVIREHPQPKPVYNDADSSLSLLRELLPDVDKTENVVLVPGTEAVSSYNLVRNLADCSVVYNGTLGIEIPYMGEPVIIAANSPYSGKGVGYEPQSREEYYHLIDRVGRDSEDFKIRRSEAKENALRAAAYQFVYNSYYCPLMPTLAAFRGGRKYWQDWDLSPESLDPWKNPSWKRTIDRFIEPLGAT